MTVNSPMGGMASAASGVKHSPIVVQSWRDVAKDSEFVTGLLDWQWPKDIPYHLVFSFVIGKGSDGTVPLESQIPRSLQKDSTRMYGFTDDHVGILSNPEFISLFDKILEGGS